MAKRQTRPKSASSSPKRELASEPSDEIVMADGEPLNLRNRRWAAFLAWLIPGAGHCYQRRYVKAGIFFFSIASSFLLGWLISGRNCVYASWNSTEKRWQFVLQAGIGLPAAPAALQAWRVRSGNPPFLDGFMLGPQHPRELDGWHSQTASGFDMGTLYTMIAGLLNILAIFDAYAGPLAPPVPRNKRDESASSDPSAADGSKPQSAISPESEGRAGGTDRSMDRASPSGQRDGKKSPPSNA